MLKAIRLKLFQQMPNYRKPSSFTVKESFPLPPYSTVIGMVHSACDFKEYHPMRVSIQGNHASDIADIETQYVFGSIPKDRCYIQELGIVKGPKSIQFLTDVELCIHIVPENPEDFETIYNGLLNPKEFISLGRREDIARIDEVEKVDLAEPSKKPIYLKYASYCPYDYMKDIQSKNTIGTIYKVPKVFDTTSKLRKWKEVVSARYLPKNIKVHHLILKNENVFIDTTLDIPVFLA